VASSTVRRGGVGGVELMGIGVTARQLDRRQAWRRQPGSAVGDGGLDQARWNRPATTAHGGVASSFERGGVGHWPRL
jgi:hypothetical protein